MSDSDNYTSVADPEGHHAIPPLPDGPVKISHKKDGRQRRRHRFHVSCPPYPATGSATVIIFFYPYFPETLDDVRLQC